MKKRVIEIAVKVATVAKASTKTSFYVTQISQIAQI